MIKPPRLKLGDTIAIIAPSGGLSALVPHRIEQAKKNLEMMGFKVKLYPTLSKFDDGKAGSVEERVHDLHRAFLDPEVKAIICAIGGTYCNAIIPKIDYNLIHKNPKIFCGYSDISILHYAIYKNAGLHTFYGPCAMTPFGEFPKVFEYTKDYFLKAVSDGQPIGKIFASEFWTDEILDWFEKKDLERDREQRFNEGMVWINPGQAEGKIIGGCLYSILQLKGTDYDMDYQDKILFIETPEGQNFKKGEPLNYIEAQLFDLINAGVFNKIKGLVVGRPFGYEEEERKAFLDLIRKVTKDYSFPVLANVNIGHADPIITIPLGVRATLDSEQDLFSIDEKGTED